MGEVTVIQLILRSLSSWIQGFRILSTNSMPISQGSSLKPSDGASPVVITRNALTPSPACVAMVKKFEALRHSVYKDIRGFCTIGWGHKFLAGDAYETIPTEKAQSLLDADLAMCARIVNHFVLV